MFERLLNSTDEAIPLVVRWESKPLLFYKSSPGYCYEGCTVVRFPNKVAGRLCELWDEADSGRLRFYWSILFKILINIPTKRRFSLPASTSSKDIFSMISSMNLYLPLLENFLYYISSFNASSLTGASCSSTDDCDSSALIARSASLWLSLLCVTVSIERNYTLWSRITLTILHKSKSF